MTFNTEFKTGQIVYFLDRSRAEITNGKITKIQITAEDAGTKGEPRTSIEYTIHRVFDSVSGVPERVVGATADMVAQKLLATPAEGYYPEDEKEKD